MQRAGADTGIAREFKTIFDLSGVPAFNQYYYFGIFIWKAIYKGFYKAWHIIPAPTIGNPDGRRNLYHMNAAKAISAEMASLVWGEECQVTVSMHGWENSDDHPDPLNEFLQKVLRDNALKEKLQESIEQGVALGGAAWKTWSEVRRDENGTEIPNTREIRIGYAMADQFFPISWDNAKVFLNEAKSHELLFHTIYI